MGVASSTTGTLVPTADIWADGRTAEEAAQAIMTKMQNAGIPVKFCYGGRLMMEATLPTYYETNIVAGGTIERVSIERMVSPSGMVYWRARFAGLLCA